MAITQGKLYICLIKQNEIYVPAHKIQTNNFKLKQVMINCHKGNLKNNEPHKITSCTWTKGFSYKMKHTEKHLKEFLLQHAHSKCMTFQKQTLH